MSEEEKKGAIDAWNKHVDGTNRKHKFVSFSSVAEEVFCDTFRTGIGALRSLTKKEILEIFTYTKL